VPLRCLHGHEHPFSSSRPRRCSTDFSGTLFYLYCVSIALTFDGRAIYFGWYQEELTGGMNRSILSVFFFLLLYQHPLVQILLIVQYTSYIGHTLLMPKGKEESSTMMILHSTSVPSLQYTQTHCTTHFFPFCELSCSVQ